MAFLSIIVPVYNTENYFDNCIQSILSQSFEDFELILVNDGSTDGSGLKCDKYAKFDKRVRVFHQINKGVSSARNQGIAEAKGQYIGFVDSDDVIDSDMYETLINNALENRADISICNMRDIRFDKKPKSFKTYLKTGVYYKDEAISLMLKDRFNSGVCNKIFISDIAKSLRFEGKVNEDAYYNFLAFLKADVSVFQDIAKYNYIHRRNSITSKFNLKYMDTIYFSKKILNIVEKKMPSHLEDAKVLDFSKNLSLLSLFLLSGTNKSPEYKLVSNNLKNYSSFVNSTKLIKYKQRFAYYLFLKSPKFYTYFMFLYCQIFAKDLIRITR